MFILIRILNLLKNQITLHKDKTKTQLHIYAPKF